MKQKNEPQKNPMNKNELMFLISTMVEVTSNQLTLADDHYQHLMQMISRMRSDGLIRTSPTRPITIVMTKKGLEKMQEEDPLSYEFYMNYTCQNHPGGSERHHVLRKKAADVQMMVYCAGGKIGSRKPTLQELLEEKAEKSQSPDVVFYMNKEMRNEATQRQSRGRVSRSAGLLLSRGFQGPIYHPDGVNMELNRNAEKSTQYQMSSRWLQLYKGLPWKKINHGILLCGDEELLEILDAPPAHRRKTTLKNAIKNPALIGCYLHVVPFTKWGTQLLKLITRYTEEELLRMVFREEQLQAKKRRGQEDAVVGSCSYYSFLRGDISKMMQLWQQHTQAETVGVVCWQEQVSLLNRIFSKDEITMRVLPKEWMQEMLEEETESNKRKGSE